MGNLAWFALWLLNPWSVQLPLQLLYSLEQQLPPDLYYAFLGILYYVAFSPFLLFLVGICVVCNTPEFHLLSCHLQLLHLYPLLHYPSVSEWIGDLPFLDY